MRRNPAERFYQRLGGHFFTTKEIDIGGQLYTEVAYGWRDITVLK